MRENTLSTPAKFGNLPRRQAGLLFLAFLFAFSMSFSQNPYALQFQNEIVNLPENIDTFHWGQMPESSKFNTGYYGWVQFYETPSQTVQDRFKANGLELIEYIPHSTYLFYFPENTSVAFLKNNGVRSVVPVEGRFKLSVPLKTPPYPGYAMDGDRILVTLQHYEHANAQFVINDLIDRQIIVEGQYKGSNNIDLSIPNNCLGELSNLPYVKWVELIVAPSIPDDTRGKSLHRSNGLDTQTSAGRNYTGVGVGVMVRDDGIVGPHIDFHGRIDNTYATGSGPDHGDGVSGILTGAGNLDPSMRGMAAGADLYVVDYESNFLDTGTQTLINNGTVQITNSSYSNGCNAGYTTITQTVDTQTNNIPSLMHVFSAGNSNNNNCGYGAGNQWGNITGGHKQGKNVIATANVYFDGSLVNSSSRGPAHDGRIKPDISANGQNQNSTDENNGYMSFGGTSGASPGIAGVSAQLYQAYADANGGALPPSGLIKATLLNTANEAGNIGPDFKFGWGIVNGLRAGLLIEENHFLSDNVSQGNSNLHSINIPAGTTQVRFMVYWTDPAASPGANPALVNDLDLVVTDPSNNQLLPWILDPTPDPVTLNLPATQGEDHLNNMEQVLIDNPETGNHEIEITGFNVPMGPQEYFVVYEIIAENLTLTYPNSGESFVPGEEEALHWDAINTTEDFLLEYSTDNGSSWNTITTVPNEETNYLWTVPNTVSGEALIRATSGAFSDSSDDAFSIAPLVDNVEVSQVCPNEATFVWDAVAGAESYDIYLLGAKYMEIVGNSTTTTISVPIPVSTDPLWVAAVAKNDTEGWESRRSIAVNHPGGLLNCTLANDLSVVDINNALGDFSIACSGDPEVIVSATLRNTGLDPQSGFTVAYQLNGDPAVEETYTATLTSGQEEEFEFATPLTIDTDGEYTLTVSILLTGDQNPNNDEASIMFYAQTEAVGLPFLEPFDTNGMPPLGWAVFNPDNEISWVERSNITGSQGSSTVAAFIDNYDYNAPGEEDVIETHIYDLNASQPTLYFDLAKAQYSSNFSDGLRVGISIDCGATFTTIYQKDGLELSTLPGYNTTNSWTPSSPDHWRTEAIDLTPFVGEKALFRFVNINGFGNSTLIDNINVDGTLGAEENEFKNVMLFPNPATNEVFLVLTPYSIGKTVEIRVLNSLGQTLQTIEGAFPDGTLKTSLNISNYATGLYFVSLKIGTVTSTKKLIVK